MSPHFSECKKHTLQAHTSQENNQHNNGMHQQQLKYEQTLMGSTMHELVPTWILQQMTKQNKKTFFLTTEFEIFFF